MSLWQVRISDILRREPGPRESGGQVRPGKSNTKPPVKGGKSAEKPAAEHQAIWFVAAGLVVMALHLILFPPVPRLGQDFPPEGDISEVEIRAPFKFTAPLLDGDVEVTRLSRVLYEPPVLRVSGTENRGARMEMYLALLDTVFADTTSAAEKIGLITLQFPVADPSVLRRTLASAEPDSVVPRMSRAWRKILRGGVADMLPAGKYDRVAVVSEQSETLRDVSGVVTQANLDERLTAELRAAGMGPLNAVETASVMRHFIWPNLVYDPDLTSRRRDAARQSVPTERGFINGERIVDQGVRVTAQQALYLDALAEKLTERGSGDTGALAVRYFNRVLLLILVMGIYGWLASIHFGCQAHKWRVLGALTVIVSLFCLGASSALARPNLGPLAVPIVLLALLVTVLFKEKIGYVTTLFVIALLAPLHGVSGSATLFWLVAGVVTVIGVRRIQQRGQFYQTILLLTVSAVMMIFFLGGEALGYQGIHVYLVGLFVPVLSVALGLFLLPLIEPLVGVCSDLTLLELSDLNHPLLQRMALEAQGTYHHSQVVGQLAEHAARAIDANALMTRVGALFHDIGKMQKSEYYVENQRPDYNKHDELSPSMSALVIGAHVKDGIELGRKWRLPQMVIDFIPEHHGTMVMEYFYHKALEADGNETVTVDDFRYPGPKPQSRETAIMMLADAVEAATRSLAKPTPSRIREITKKIMDKRMLNGELDESQLTLRDLAKIREAFIPLLTGIHHARIVYPNQNGGRGAEKTQERQSERKTRS